MDRTYTWNEEKNSLLKQERGVSFEQVVDHILRGDLLAIEVHSNQEKYPGQRIYVVRMNEYAYLVPFVEQGNVLFLKTIYPSRRATRRYLRKPKE
jgi:uncharacterized DUF497 family protein